MLSLEMQKKETQDSLPIVHDFAISIKEPAAFFARKVAQNKTIGLSTQQSNSNLKERISKFSKNTTRIRLVSKYLQTYRCYYTKSY